MKRRRRPVVPVAPSAFAGFRFPAEVIMLAVRWYLRFVLSYRDLEELLAERGVEVDHVTIYRWVQRFTPRLVDAAARAGMPPVTAGSWTRPNLKVSGIWKYLYRAVDQFGQVIDILLSQRRDAVAARPFFHGALACAGRPVEVTTDRAPVYPGGPR
jgi:IS6 family transposase